MKRTLLMLGLVAGILGWGLPQAFAAAFPPTIDGVLGAGEWANSNASGVPYPYYLEVFDPNEADNAYNNTDISHGVLLQELSLFGGTTDSAPPDTIPDFADDGVYLLIEVYSPPPTLDWQGSDVTGIPLITMQGDLTGDGLSDFFNIFIRHYNLDPTAGVGPDVVEVCVGSLLSCLGPSGGPWSSLTGAGGAFARGSVLEYFVPAGTFGTFPSPPGTPFPFSFVGKVTYDNGMGGPLSSDDIVIGTLIPEPSTMVLLGTTLLGLIHRKRFGL